MDAIAEIAAGFAKCQDSTDDSDDITDICPCVAAIAAAIFHRRCRRERQPPIAKSQLLKAS